MYFFWVASLKLPGYLEGGHVGMKKWLEKKK
jgi:hypothetical protein